ncbi:SDA1-like protein [Cryptosporidium canis]|uniref:Telomerase reverse transcriptase n=1 Tax=Cryptosporidium canis TaxID=195482 RepID=A0A9D5DHB3_9CRYT|nr:SDA1-like protein [Cryptosporidium canis]
MSAVKGALSALLRGGVMTLGEYLGREGVDCGNGADPSEEFKRLLEWTFVLEDPFIPSGLKESFLRLRQLKFSPLDGSLDVGGDKRKYRGIGMDRVLHWSSAIAQSYSASSRTNCSCSARGSRSSEANGTLLHPLDSNKGEEQMDDGRCYHAQDFELLLHQHFPRIRMPLRGGFLGQRVGSELPKPRKTIGFCIDCQKFQNIQAWELLLRKIGPVQVLFMLVCFIMLRKPTADSDILIQQTGRMLTNDFLDELGRLRAAEAKRAQGPPSPASPPAETTPTREPKPSNIFSINIPSYSGIMYCDHFPRRGGLPCVSILRLIPPNRLGARTLLRFVGQTDHLFKDHDRQGLIGLIGSYEMTKYSHVRCKLASSLLDEFQLLLLNIRSVSTAEFLASMCPIQTIKRSDFENLNKIPVLQFETDLTKVVNFLRLYLIKVLPKNILGTTKNLKTFINKKVPTIVNLHIRETFHIKHAMNEMEVSSWVNRILEEKQHEFIRKKQSGQNVPAGSKKVPAVTRSRIRRSLINLGRTYLARNIYFLIVYLINPILRRHFYATEIEGSNKIRYFRHPVWIKIVRQADKGYLNGILRGVGAVDLGRSENLYTIEEVARLLEKNSDYSENIPKIRWLPKSKGLRPLLNLSKVGSGQILQQILEKEHFCERKRMGFCDCNSIWTAGELPTGWVNYNHGNNGGGFGLRGGSTTPTPFNPISSISNIADRPSSSRVVNANRPSTNNMLFYPSKILRSFLLRRIGRRYLGTSIVRYGDVYKSIKNWWSGDWRDRRDDISRSSTSNQEDGETPPPNKRIYIVKADLLNCFENINKARIFEFLDQISLPEEITLLSLYSRALSKTNIIPPFDHISKDSFRDELGRASILTSKGRLNSVPIFEEELETPKKPNQSSTQDGPASSKEPPFELKEFCISKNSVSILGHKKADIFTFLNSRRVINWKLAREMLRVHLHTNFVRLRTVNKTSRLTKTRQLESSGKYGKRFLSLFKQSFGIPQGSSVSYILCCLYYGFLDHDPDIQDLLGPSGPGQELQAKSYQGHDLETSSKQYSDSKENEISNYQSNTKRRRIESSHYSTAIDLDHDNHPSLNQHKNLLLRWVDDFLFLTTDLESARKFLKLLYIQKLWGSNVSKDKINSNFLWIDHDGEIIILKNGEYPSSPHESLLDFMETGSMTDKDEMIQKSEVAMRQFQKQVLWSGMKFSSESTFLNCKISPWKSLELVCVMDTITLTTKRLYPSNNSNSHKFKTISVPERFQKSNYMWSVLGLRLIRYFDFRTRNGLLFDCKINSTDTVLDWISSACHYNIYSYKKHLPNSKQWDSLIRCAVHSSVIASLNSRHKVLGISDFFKSTKTKYNIHSSILKKEFDYNPGDPFSIVREHSFELPKMYRIKKKGVAVNSK